MSGMQRIFDRTLLAHFAMIVAVCVGGWMMIVQPLQERAVTMQAELDESDIDPEGTEPAAVERLADRVRQIGRQAEAVRSRSRLGDNTSTLYRMIRDLAESHAVELSTLDPQSQVRDPARGVRSRRIDVGLRGEYEAIAQFVGALQDQEGYVRVNTFTLSPSGSAASGMLQARLQCEVIGFDLPDPVRELVEAPHDHP